MTIREQRQQLEHSLIGPYGILSENSTGRLVPEEECEIRTCFQRDIDRITHSKAFRRLKRKTQVFLQPEGDHYRTRLTHTLEVTRLARTVSRALMLNEDLTEAIALGHDLGHTPFGHAGERALDKLCPGGFRHYEQSLRVVDRLEKDGLGLNLCNETRMGIVHHTVPADNESNEGIVVRLCDWIAFVNHDLDDSIRAGLLSAEEVPSVIRENLGDRNSMRINTLVTDLILNSTDGEIKMSPDMWDVFMAFKKYMYSEIYVHPIAKGEEKKVGGIIDKLFDYYSSRIDALPEEYRKIAEQESIERAAADYISGMTDTFAIDMYEQLYIPFSWKVK